MENKFCFLKGIVTCDSGRIQDCNNKRTTFCPLEKKKMPDPDKGGKKKTFDQDGKKGSKKQGFCFLKGLVDCGIGRVQDCNIKRVEKCPKE